MNKIGIYITGLGQSFHQESVEKYATRFKNEMNYNVQGVTYDIKTEKITYSEENESTVVSIIEINNNEEKIVYKFYDFKYRDSLVKTFNSYNILYKNFLLFLLVLKKIPLLIKRLIFSNSYSRPGQTMYVFIIFLIISLAILFLIPSTFIFVKEFFVDYPKTKPNVPQLINKDSLTVIFNYLSDFSIMFVVPITTLLLLIIPESKTIVTDLATEFASLDNYIQYGEQSQCVLGNMDLLIEYIAENEPDAKIHIHSYSFGTILAYDLLFPIGNIPSNNSKRMVEMLITIGSPYEFVKAYYPNFYDNRSLEIQDDLKWINVYSISDAFATNFRKDTKIGPSEFGLLNSTLKPKNLNYEIAPVQSFSIVNFITLYHLKMHQHYWDKNSQGQSCMRMIYNEMLSLEFNALKIN